VNVLAERESFDLTQELIQTPAVSVGFAVIPRGCGLGRKKEDEAPVASGN
jgi:hypothetical protein